MEISKKKYEEIEREIRLLNILHRLDKYRWATEYDVEHLKKYTDKLKQAYMKMVALK